MPFCSLVRLALIVEALGGGEVRVPQQRRHDTNVIRIFHGKCSGRTIPE